jgi:hypothetical protein
MREDEHGWDPKGPPTLVDLDAALDGTGNLIAWSSTFFHPLGMASPVALVAAILAGLPHEMDMGPGGILGNSAIPYGNMVQTVSRVLMEQVTFTRSRVTSVDWASYRIIGFPEMADVVIELIDRPTEKPWGSGEPSAAVVPAAISNAVFNATGAGLRSVPFTPDKVKAALMRL